MKKLLAIFVIVAAAYGAWRALRPSEVDATRGRDLFYGRAWLDHMPSSRTDTFHVFGTSKRNPFGWFAERSIWKGEWERFRYAPRGDGKLEILLPHSEQRVRLTYRAWRCSEKDFDYCLELSGRDGPKKYYSKRGWEKESLDEADIEALLAEDAGE